jgi:hypothetical protein
MIASVITLAPAAQAGTIYQIVSLDAPLVFNEFDPSLGTLDAVTFYLVANVALRYQVTSPYSYSVIGPGTGSAEVDLIPPSGTTISFYGSWADQTQTDPGTNLYNFLVHNIGVADYNGLSDGGPLTSYEGTGTFALGVMLSGYMHFNLFQATVLSVGLASGNVTLEYDYTPGSIAPASVPEPPSLWLALTAGVFISLRIRGRLKRIPPLHADGSTSRGRGRPDANRKPRGHDSPGPPRPCEET